ncbi:hypothetical protein V7O66_05585 [Methanolobus sp. ZRKC3]|uniref:GbsR/MarR family transcriptional regulator n=1 Tax=Methanolobus sp. ZRKC3 TaxID=3125786 RepID=UPI0032502328
MSDTEKKILEIGNEIFRGYGVDSLTATILSILNFEPEEISMEELAERTGYSLASISLKMKNIEVFWSIKRIQKPGSRKTYFYMEKDLLDAFLLQLKNGYEAELNIAKKRISPLIEEYRKEASSEEQRKKLHLFEDYHEQIIDFEKVIEYVYEKIDEIKSEKSKDRS